MNEQLRLFVTVTLCTAIWLGWQLYVGDMPPPAAPALSAGAPEASEPMAVGPGALAGAREAPPAAPRPAVPASRPAVQAQERNIRTARFVGRFVNGEQPGFVTLHLPAFAQRAADLDAAAPSASTPCAGDGSSDCGESLASHGLGPQSRLAVTIDREAVPLDFAAAVAPVDGDEIALTGKSSRGVRIDVTLRPAKEHYVWDYSWRLTNDSGEPASAEVALTLAQKPAAMDRPVAKGPLSWLRTAGERIDKPQAVWQQQQRIARKAAKDLHKVGLLAGDDLDFAGIELQYFLLALLPGPGGERSAVFLEERDEGVSLHGTTRPALLAAGAAAQGTFRVFLGPKRETEMLAVTPAFSQVIDYNMLGVPLGFLGRPMMASLRYFFAWTHSWGLAIVLLTLAVKAILLPANLKSAVSIRRMQGLKPELEAVKRRYPDDTQAQQAATLALYKKHQINPASGCLPVLLQIPVWLTLYRALASAVDLYQQPFLWLSDLTAREPFPLLALLAGAFTILQQRVTPMAADNAQARTLMWVMPIMVTVFMLNMPAGLVLYILVNSILTLAQQVVINRRAL